MTVNFEIKGQLAKLLATEDLVVEHKKVSTACFNVHSRVLTLPLWERASNAVYDMLVAHEVGHALHTPDEDWRDRANVPQSFVNIVEDVRVEKLMKRRYAGLSKTMFAGYKELAEQDFFSIGEDDHNKYSFADRINLHYKIGNFIDVDFSEGEKSIVKLIGECETFADVLIAAEELYKYSKQNQEEVDNDQNVESIGISEDGDSTMQVESVPSDQENNSESSKEGDDGDDTEDNSKKDDADLDTPSYGGTHDNLEVKTDQKLKDAIEQLATFGDMNESVYLELPELDLNSIIASNKEIHSYIEQYWNEDTKRMMNGGFAQNEIIQRYVRVDSEYVKFKKSAQKEVNYLVKEFECKKAADSYARATTARTGVLDCSKLHTYKFNEDLFKKVTTLADGKNHGLIFVLDWSGSMDRVLLDTLKQLYNLLWFCKKVGIPFEVYAFSNEWRCVTYDSEGKAIIPTQHHKKIDGHLRVSDDFAMMNFFTSKTSSKELDKQMLAIYRIASAYGSRYYVNNLAIPPRLSLSGTPLNEAMISLNYIIPSFQSDNKIQKVHTIVLTDGEGAGMTYYAECVRQENIYVGVRGFHTAKCYIRDRKSGYVYAPNPSYDYMTAQTDTLLRYLRNKYPSMSLIGMRVLGTGEANTFIRRYFYNNQKTMFDIQTKWKKEKSFSMTTEGYHKYFGISSTSLSNESEFVVDTCASKTQIRSAFKKSMKSKQFNKKILNEFIQLIA